MPWTRSWTTEEDERLLALAGSRSVQEIAEELGRSQHAVRNRMSDLLLSARHWESTLEWCPNCCAWRTRITDGYCPVCSRMRTRDEQRAAEARLLRRLTPGEAAMKRPQLQQSRLDPKPRPTPTSGMDEYHASRARDRDAVAIQEWEVRQLDRENAARRRRIERLRRQMEF